MPYLWPADRADLKTRFVIALVCLVLAKVANATVPYLNGLLVDGLDHHPTMQIFAAIMGLIAIQVVARIMISGFAQLRDGVFANVQYHAMREVAVSTFAHIHRLSLRFHLDRKTGGLSRIIERGTKGIDTLLSIAIFNTFPTVLELAITSAIFIVLFNVWFAAATIVMVVLYVWFTFAITRWRIQFRRDMNQSDQDANTKAVDSLLNYETVKYFNNEWHETRRFDRSMERFANASIQSTTSLTVLNIGQAILMSLGLGAVLVLTAVGIMQHSGHFTVGSLTMATGYLVALQQPLNFLGTAYREITQSLVDMDAMFRLLHQPQEVQDKPGAPDLKVTGGEIRFDNVVFCYDPARTVLKGISFVVPAGKTVAVVGPSGAGTSTI